MLYLIQNIQCNRQTSAKVFITYYVRGQVYWSSSVMFGIQAAEDKWFFCLMGGLLYI